MISRTLSLPIDLRASVQTPLRTNFCHDFQLFDGKMRYVTQQLIHCFLNIDRVVILFQSGVLLECCCDQLNVESNDHPCDNACDNSQYFHKSLHLRSSHIIILFIFSRTWRALFRVPEDAITCK